MTIRAKVLIVIAIFSLIALIEINLFNAFPQLLESNESQLTDEETRQRNAILIGGAVLLFRPTLPRR